MPRQRSVVFLHGWTMRGSIFNDLVARLPAEFDFHTPDLPGHGKRARLEPSLEVAANTLAGVLKAQDLRDVVLVGWSMGAAVAWQFIEQYGADRIAGLMTVDMSPRLGCNADWLHGLIDQGDADLAQTTQRMIADWPGTAEAIATTMFARREGAPGYSRKQALDQILSNDPASMIAMWGALVAMDKRELIGQLPCPLLATFGARSRVYPKSAAAWLARTAPRGRMHAFEDSGHSPHLEQPEAFAETLVDFAGSV
ncbi:pimeloyl-[acyl-carrier protein] methyl ester esterase [Hoeflea halophila]|uniref:Pimeloyl-[acyl-carrier protein] methyl ester esterase n=1 Tax=Hoeflea halophila TaxID=714899 RepID=A0A286I8T2_9HYPH|nr:alpha/beta hydrolase [Hoeflea halophila]SOE16538.1 pimeloyl-[acyl-carrier protein] methyl ester esterase [Hoeflea halophila]